MTFLTAFGGLADHHPSAVKVIFGAICVFAVSFAVCGMLMEHRRKRRQRNERLFKQRVQTTIEGLNRRATL